jgi:hypothetical protein
MLEKRRREYPSKNRPSTAISFDADQLVLLKKIGDAIDRPLAYVVRHACAHWLQSTEGQDLSRRVRERSMLNTNIMLPVLGSTSTPEESKS